ncbi:protein FAR1-RELATED SEQUENCE 6-like [Silene latifolia]|uniref:protein FAR1-RELATED SEQUENCE 6-like n=1 Tax=Silene latifolia TaxID=37657 RepID=UPI003D78A700
MDQEHFKDTLRDFCIQEGFHIIIVKADKSRYTAECATVGCEWRIHASVLQDGTTWAIKSIRAAEHGCNGVKSYNPLANAEWVSNKLIEDIRADPVITRESIQKKLMERYGLNMKKSTLYRMRDKALQLINGGHDTSYGLLPTYCEVVKLTNPGSYAICAWTTMDTPEKPLQNKSLFVSFSAQFKGLIAGCRSLIGVDGTHLKGNYGGVLLSAIAVDGNNEIFPVAVGVVESENKESWSNFFWHLKQVLAESGREDWTIISDRQKGIEPALEQVWPSCYRRFCARHLCKNFKKDYPGLLMHKLFWKLVNSYSSSPSKIT